MGCASSKKSNTNVNHIAHELQINSHIKQSKAAAKLTKKLLLLGIHSSGKSTLFKSIKCVKQGGFDDDESLKTCSIIRQNCLSSIITLLEQSKILYDIDPEQNGSCLLNPNDDIASSISIIMNYEAETFSGLLNYDELQKLADSIWIVWASTEIQSTFRRHGVKFFFADNMEHFFEKIYDIMSHDYIPTKDDIIKSKQPATDIIEYSFIESNVTFVIYDIGQQNYKKKWVHDQFFEDITAIIYVTALPHFYEILFENDTDKNAMHEAIDVFKEIINLKCFAKTEMILFLNKDDIFREKLALQIPLNICFSKQAGWSGKEWLGPYYKPIGNDIDDEKSFNDCYQAAIQFIIDAFDAQKIINKDRRIFSHVTVGTDVDIIKTVFWDVQNIFIRGNLYKGGLM